MHGLETSHTAAKADIIRLSADQHDAHPLPEFAGRTRSRRFSSGYAIIGDMIRLGVHVGAWLVVVWACVAAPGADVSQESLIRELASPQFEARQRAHGALAELGVGALPSLEIGAAGENAETRRRCV